MYKVTELTKDGNPVRTYYTKQIIEGSIKSDLEFKDTSGKEVKIKGLATVQEVGGNNGD